MSKTKRGQAFCRPRFDVCAFLASVLLLVTVAATSYRSSVVLIRCGSVVAVTLRIIRVFVFRHQSRVAVLCARARISI